MTTNIKSIPEIAMEHLSNNPDVQSTTESDLERANVGLNNGNSENTVKLEPADNLPDYAEKECGDSHPNSPNRVGFVVSENSKNTVKIILEKLKPLSHIEKFLIHLKLSEDVSALGDPLKQPLNPLGSRSEIYRTISWIKTHLEEDPDISLPKQQVYDEYFNFCSRIKIKPLSQADFGKVMKQVYPNVKARRLGTRGHSRYCYSGLRNTVELKPPSLSDMELTPPTEKSEVKCTVSSSAWLIVKKWSEGLLGTQFCSIQALAFFLVINCNVGLGTEAAKQLTELHVEEENTKCFGSHREMQLQLQRKIQQKSEINKDRKRRVQSGKPVTVSKTNNKKLKLNNGGDDSGQCPTSTTDSSQGNLVCDNVNDTSSIPEFKTFQKPVQCDEINKDSHQSFKIAIPRLDTTLSELKASSSSTQEVTSTVKYKNLQPKQNAEPCDIIAYNPQIAENRSQTMQDDNSRVKEQDAGDDFDTELPLSRERLNSISNVEKDAMDDYLGKIDGHQDEELSKFYNNNNNNKITKSNNTSEISQLRQLLEQNGVIDKPTLIPESTLVTPQNLALETSILKQTGIPFNNFSSHSGTIVAALTSNVRRRVSFETPPQQHEEGVPPSPNTRSKNFSFTPISPHSPGERNSKCSSTSASPFVSPRNTPVQRGKNINHNINHQNAGILLPIGHTFKSIGPSAKIKRELRLDVSNEVDQKFPSKYSTLSAPTSPMCSKSMLQKLLNSSGKVPYSPNYVNCTSVKPDPGNESIQIISEYPQLPPLGISNFRSQSVPLSQMISDKCNYALDSSYIIPNEVSSNDFNDLDPIAETDSVNVNNIINTLDESTCDNSIYDVSIVGNNNLSEYGLIAHDSLDRDDFDETILYKNHALPPSFRVLNRSQSIDLINMNSEPRILPSRSVPSTPLPMTRKLLFHDVKNSNNSRSYPSTPLLQDNCFDYNVQKDCLLNGQTIKMVDDTESFTSYLDYNRLSNDSLVTDLGTSSLDVVDDITDYGTAGIIDDSVLPLSDQNFNGDI